MKSHLCCVVACLTGLLILLAACNPSPPSPSESLPQETNPVHETSPVRVTTPEETSPVQETASEAAPSAIPGEEASQAELWMQATLALRSVIMELDTIYTGGKSTPVSAKVDAAGNIYLSMPVSIPEAVAATPDLPQPGDFELFIIDGTAYTRIGTENTVTPDEAYLTMLEDLLIGPEGPGMWLDLLTEDSFTTAGSETYGGFAATKYIVDGQVENNRITGTIWIDDQTSALAGADLSIPEDLFFPPASGLSGDVQIVFRVEQADMPVLAVP